MSHAGKCPRALSIERLGLPVEQTPGWLDMAAEEGRWHEARIKQWLNDNGLEVTNEQMEVVLDYEDIQLVGHIDGMVRKNEKNTLLEIKSMSQYEFDRWMRGRFTEFPSYAVQLALYMTALGISNALYIVKNRSSGYLDTQEINELPCDISYIVHVLREVEARVAKGEMFPGTYEPSLIECRRCLCKTYCVPSVTVKQQDIPALMDAVRDWRQAKEMERKAEELKESAEEKLKSYMLSNNLKKWSFEHLSMSLGEANRTTYDTELLKKYLSPEQLESAQKVTSYEYFRIYDELKNHER
jgi:hypothetical protein